MTDRNQIGLTGRLTERDALRHTPAGVPIIGFRVTHESEQIEAGAPRQVLLELGCVAVNELAHLVAAAAPGARMNVSGFLAPRAKSSRQLVLHVTDIEFS